MTNDEHLAANARRLAALKAEFEENPRAYVAKYGTVNSYESAPLVIWLLDRLERLESVSPIRQDTTEKE